jgi:hypothetical protein
MRDLTSESPDHHQMTVDTFSAGPAVFVDDMVACAQPRSFARVATTVRRLITTTANNRRPSDP